MSLPLGQLLLSQAVAPACLAQAGVLCKCQQVGVGWSGSSHRLRGVLKA